MERALRALSFPTKRDATTLVLGLMGFFIGRFVVLGVMNPAGISFASNFIGSKHFYIVAPLALMGIATLTTGGFLVKYAVAFGLLLVASVVVSRRKASVNIFVKSIIGAMAMLGGGLTLAIMEQSPYLATMAALESAMTLFLTYILKKGIDIVAGRKRRKLLTGEEAASIAILSGTVVAGMVDVYVGDVALRLFISSFVILTAAHRGGPALGATVGIVMGVILHLVGYQSASLALIMAMGGLAAGLFHRQPRPVAFAAMAVASLALAAYLDTAYITSTLLFSGLSGGLLFLITPANFYFNINSSLTPALDNSDEYLRRVQAMASERLNAFADAFGKLSASFLGLGEKRSALGHREIGTLVEDIHAKACDGCTMQEYCWQANFYDTYQAIFAMLGSCEARGRLELRDLPEAFRDTCISQPHFTETLNRLFELHKLHLEWNNKLLDSRELVAQQLGGVSSIVRGLARDMGLAPRFREDLEQAILRELSAARLEPDGVVVMENKQNRLEINLAFEASGRTKKSIKSRDIATIVSRVVGRRMVALEEPMRKGISLREEQRYRTTTGVARATKRHSSESGDSYSSIQLKNGHAILALSDGMGSGRRASTESTTAIELLEDLLESGFETEMAIRMINSALVLKSVDDTFSTLDICSLDLYSGEAEFFKISASPSFIMRASSVSTVRSSSLPMGILNNIDMETTARQLRAGDILVMVTDGICDAGQTLASPPGEWIAQKLPDLAGRNPQDIADILLDEAHIRAGAAIRDDMTVLSVKILEGRQ